MKQLKLKTVVLVAGTFDLFHSGHLEALRIAKSLGDYLVVSVAGDKRSRTRKGFGRPILPQKERASIVKEIRFVDRVLTYSDWKINPAFRALRTIRPDIYLVEKGANPDEKKIERKLCKRLKIQVVEIISLRGRLSTSSIISSIIKKYR